MNGSCKYPNLTADRRAIAASESVCLTGAFGSWEWSARARRLLNMFRMIVAREAVTKEADHRSGGLRHLRSGSLMIESSTRDRDGLDIRRRIGAGPLSAVVWCRVTRILDVFGFGDEKVDRSIRSVGIVFGSEQVETYGHDVQHVYDGLHFSMTWPPGVAWSFWPTIIPTLSVRHLQQFPCYEW